ncbi:hypothetical protein ACFYVR_26750 [Rhodococcus sp. NPDC003318]|uniref:hypothetical protein n=1 Tax=Rhodococcus sp. NPDC003318 TaxID=3364503 RepID=UPI0036ACAF00
MPAGTTDQMSPIRAAVPTEELYQREYLYEVTGLPNTRNLPLIAEWPEIGLEPATTHLVRPDPSELVNAIIPLP